MTIEHEALAPLVARLKEPRRFLQVVASPHPVDKTTLHAQIYLDVAQRFVGGQLRKRYSHQELIEAREVFDLVLSTPAQDHPAGCLQKQISHDLRKDELTRVHASPQQMRSAEHAPSPKNDSNRGQEESQIYSNKS